MLLDFVVLKYIIFSSCAKSKRISFRALYLTLTALTVFLTSGNRKYKLDDITFSKEIICTFTSPNSTFRIFI